MDPFVRWLRRRIVRRVMAIAAVWLGAVTAAACAALVFLAGGGPVETAAVAFVVAQITVAGGLVRAMLTNPLSYSYLQARSAAPARFELTTESPDGEVLDRYVERGLVWLVGLGEPSPDGAIEQPYDLFQSAEQTVIVARNRRSGAVSVFSRIDDGRILVTDALLTVLHNRLVVNVAESGALDDLLSSHLRAIDGLVGDPDPGGAGGAGRSGPVIVADDGFAFVEALAIEHEALLAIGPLLAPFLSLGNRSSPLRFLVPFHPDAATAAVAVAPGAIRPASLDLVGL